MEPPVTTPRWLPIILGLAVPAACQAADEHPLLVGGQAHGAGNTRALADLGLGNFAWIPKPGYPMGNTPWDRDPKGPRGILADVDACLASGLHFAISQTSPVQARRHDNLNARPWGRPYGDRLSFGSAVQPRTWPPNDNRSPKVVPEQGVQVVTGGEV